ncbi:shikimate dehydrogenase [Desulforamulus reducens MI-1]|uniref:Shikimate dehydrogenase (NADP(+)) n=1 Tax=Desulforamulus reducens (strain ATCC BAA-1160 / DSM 100696 / MI-1) TaxID=349161 RepID=AROE_DESRM|nr:shikimate dehydrogenase [Desulforamulus reducens]A4J3A0.1 RecName: Full=Shikimate dehydrogenase (NADP(+)); Short=SDH [Desulforamulus reducens MI-1]ABO49553.1 shikimate dehydrogenase [Desulforamulus reducens MI-1]
MGHCRINGKTQVCGLFGFPVEHSFSPAMHNAAFQQLDLNWTYVPFRVHPDNLKQAVTGIFSLNMAGVNVTVPHKQRVMPFLDELEPAARIIGAVNTIVNNNGKLVGYNTDGKGFVRALTEEARFNPLGKSAILIGAGGAARAVAVQLALSGLRTIYITNRNQEKAEELARDILESTDTSASMIPWGNNLLGKRMVEVDLVVQATPLGMSPEVDQVPEFPFQMLTPQHLVCDLIYNPEQTCFLRRAKSRGSKTMNGLAMLLYQGVLAFELWTGFTAPVDVMRNVLHKQVAKG